MIRDKNCKDVPLAVHEGAAEHLAAAEVLLWFASHCRAITTNTVDYRIRQSDANKRTKNGSTRIGIKKVA